ncbi:MAG: diguanylate cyclase [Anaerolineales bacterium]|nr:diguanylate cyclase [Anaerolineales bacterium]
MRNSSLNFYLALLFFATAWPYAWLGLTAWRKRPAVAVIPFSWAMLGMSVWSFGYGLEILAPTIFLKLLAIKFEYLGMASIPVFLFVFSLEFIGKRHLLPQKTETLLWLFPSFFIALAWTNELHHLLWSQASIVRNSGFYLLHLNYRLFIWIQVAFSYLLVLASNLLFLRELLKSRELIRSQTALILLGLLCPLIGNFIFITDTGVISKLDFTPFFFIPTAFALYWVVLKHRLSKVLPIEHLSVLRGMREGVIVIDTLNRVLYINPVAENLLGRSEAEAIGQPLNRLSPMYGNDLVALASSGMSQGELKLGDGEQARVYETTVSAAFSTKSKTKESIPDRMITLYDVTQRLEAERALHRRELVMSAISSATVDFLNESAWEQVIPGALKNIGSAVDVSHVYVFINYTDKDKQVFTSLCYEWAAPEAQAQIENPAFRHCAIQAAGLERWKNFFAQGQRVLSLVKDLPPAEQAFLQPMGSISMMAFPILVNQKWWGFLLVDECGFTRYWKEIEVKAFQALATIFSSAEARTRAEQKLLRRQNALALLQAMVREALQAKDLNAMAQDIVADVASLINADGCFITLWDEANQVTYPLAIHGEHKQKYSGLKVDSRQLTFSGSALSLDKTLVVEDVPTSKYADTALIADSPYQSLIVVPLKAMQKKLGTILLAFYHPHTFTAEEISISEQAASLIALASEKFQMMEQAQRRAQTSETLRKAGAAITQTLETDEIISRVLQELQQVVPYDSASVQLLKGNELEIVGGSGFKDLNKIIGMKFPIPGDNPNTLVLKTGVPQMIGDVTLQYARFQEAPNDHVRAWLGVPLIANEKIIGLLTAESSEPDDFTVEDLNILALFANQVAGALANSQRFKATQDQTLMDPLTGLYNRRGLFQIGEVEFQQAVEQERNFSAIMLDLDHFKAVNDTHGHDVGDLVLKAIADICKKSVREADIVGRYGGEEILILLPDTALDVCARVAERIRQSVEQTPFRVKEDVKLNLTASLGIAFKTAKLTNLDVLIKYADQALYIAKHKGRNQVAQSG